MDSGSGPNHRRQEVRDRYEEKCADHHANEMLLSAGFAEPYATGDAIAVPSGGKLGDITAEGDAVYNHEQDEGADAGQEQEQVKRQRQEIEEDEPCRGLDADQQSLGDTDVASRFRNLGIMPLLDGNGDAVAECCNYRYRNGRKDEPRGEERQADCSNCAATKSQSAVVEAHQIARIGAREQPEQETRDDNKNQQRDCGRLKQDREHPTVSQVR